MKYFVTVIIAILTSLFFVPSVYNVTLSQSVDIVEEEVAYQLPYPGLLPDHPLFFLKQIRDQLLIFTTRDNGKKALVYLELSDKHMASALALAEKGREQLAKDQLFRAEERFLLIPPLLAEVKEQGGAYPQDLIIDLFESNKKHREVITEVMKKSTESEISAVENLLKLNDDAKAAIESIQ